MAYSGLIDLEHLIDCEALWKRGECPFTFLAFPISLVDDHGMPNDTHAKQYIAAVQKAGVAVGIWLSTPVEGTGYAAVAPSDIHALGQAVDHLSETGQFPQTFAAELSERLFEK